MSLLRSKFPTLTIQPPSVALSPDGYEYCPLETLQPTQNGENHWVLLSSLNGNINIYDIYDLSNHLLRKCLLSRIIVLKV